MDYSIENKKGETVTLAFKIIFKSDRIPKFLWTDKGSEFYNKSYERIIR